MNGNTKLANVAPRASLPLDVGSVHSVEDLKAMFEPRRRRFGNKIPAAIAFPNSASETTRMKCSWLSQHGNDKARKLVQEKVKLFEEGHFDSSLSFTKRGLSMDDLLFLGNSLPRRKNLLKRTKSSHSSAGNRKPDDNTTNSDHYYTSDKTMSDYVGSSSWDDEWEHNKEDPPPPPETFQRSYGRHQKRASTGRILFEDNPCFWKLTDSFATKILCECSSTSPESHSISSHDDEGPNSIHTNNLPENKTTKRPHAAHHQRRYSTGRIGQVHVTDEKISSSKAFWQVYQPSTDATASRTDDPTTKLRADYCRTVRFDHHVTVWTFVKGTKKVRRTKRRRRRKDFRFNEKGHKHFMHTSPPDMPLRQGTNHDGIASPRHDSVVLPQTDRHFRLGQLSSVVSNSKPDTSPPMIPKRRPSLTQNDILSVPVLENEETVLFAPRRDSTSTWGSLPSFANHDIMDEAGDGGLTNDNPQPTTHAATEGSCSLPPSSHSLAMMEKTDATSNESSLGERRTKALQWFHRFGMPNRDSMKKLVTRTTGMDITIDDVDLLPWDDTMYRRTGWASLYHQSQQP